MQPLNTVEQRLDRRLDMLRQFRPNRYDFRQAEAFADWACEKAVGMKYRWAEGDTAHLLGEIYSVRGDKAKGRKWLKKAVVCRKEILDPKVKESEGMLEGMG